MDKNLPDKWIRKAIFTAINNLTVQNPNTLDNIQIPCFDTRVPPTNTSDFYVLMTTQTNEVDKNNKCEWFWESSILLDVVTYYESVGDFGDRQLADNILDEIRNLTNGLVLDVSSNLTVLRQTQNFPNDLSTTTQTEQVYRKFMRLELTIK